MKRKLSMEWETTLKLGVLALPAFIWFLVFCYIPMFGVVIAFKDFDYAKGVFQSKWIGFENFRYMFASSDAWRILKNTVCYNAVFILLMAACAITVALMLSSIENKTFIKACQTTVFLPFFVSWVIVAYIARQFFALDNGVVNQLFEKVGIAKIPWYTTPGPWPVVLIIAYVWKNIGFNTIVYYGAILGIDQTLYEAAEIDGATGIQKIFKITLPLLKPTIMILLIMAVGNILKADFGLFYYVPNNAGSLYKTTDVIDTYVYRLLKGAGDLSASSAASFFQSVVGFVLVVLANGITRKIDSDNSLF